MIANKEVQPLENSSVKLTVTVEKDAAKKQYIDLLKTYSKNAQVRGFRKGKVPPKVLEQKYGEGIREEATVKLIEESLKQVFDEIEEKPLPYSQPELAEGEELGKIVEGEDFTFSVVYDVYPEVKLGEYEGFELEIPAVSIRKADENRELEKIQEQNSMVVEKAEGSAVEKDDIITVDYVELDDEGKEKEGSSREDFVFTVGTEYNIYKFDDELIGMKKDEEKVIEKSFPEDYDYSELAGSSVKVKVKVKVLKQKDIPELDDELAKDVSEEYETIDDLRKATRKQLKEVLDKKMRETKSEAVFDKIIEGSEVSVPKSMVQAELQNSWQRFVQQSRMPEEQLLQFLSMQGQNKEAIFEEWKPQAERSIKVQLLMEKINEKEEPKVTDNEVEKELKSQAEAAGQDYEELKETFEKNNLTEMVKTDIRNRKLIDLLLKKNSFNKGKKVDYLEFVQGQQ